MQLENLRLESFKNYDSLNLDITAKVTCILGKNGSGKTNLLDAVHYLCLTKSALNAQEKQLALGDADYFFVKGNFSDGQSSKHEVLGGYKKTDGKFFKLDTVAYSRLSEHVGKFPVVFVHPHDIDLVREGSEYRRKFFDGILCQCDQEYLRFSIEYKQLIKQRNALLKTFSDTRHIDHDLIAVYDKRLLELNEAIYDKREALNESFIPVFLEYYRRITDNQEDVSLVYKSAVGSNDFKAKYKVALEKDIFLQRTTMGVHKDEYQFVLGEKLLKRFGSQGQQKSFIISLQLAKLKYMEQVIGQTPILLLDDIFDKLDDDRIQKLVNMIARDELGQVFITDANVNRTKDFFFSIKKSVAFITIENGKVIDQV